VPPGPSRNCSPTPSTSSTCSAWRRKLYVYQREPGWIEPRQEREFTRRELWLYRHVPLAQRAHRAWLFYQAVRRFKGFDVRSNRPNVELVPHEVTRVTPAGLVNATGAERQVDMLILSTGSQPTSFLKGLEVKGRDGRGGAGRAARAWQG
jgi:cyclohexanone monooxygenase